VRAVVFAIRRNGGDYYTHGYPGTWNAFPKFQAYHSLSAANRQANVLKKKLPISGVEVVQVFCEEA